MKLIAIVIICLIANVACSNVTQINSATTAPATKVAATTSPEGKFEC